MDTFSKITVIIPFYNAEKYLAEAVESVLKQSRLPNEIILVDDGSQDNSIQVAERFQPNVTIIRQSNKGAAAARNAGLEKALGDLIAFLDADDYWEPDTLEHLSDTLLENKDHNMIFGRMKEFVSPELGEETGLKPREDSHTKKAFMVGTGLIQKKIFDQIGKFDESLRSAEFIDWINRAEFAGFAGFSSEKVILHRRLHLTNSTKVSKQLHKDYTQMLRMALARKRGK